MPHRIVIFSSCAYLNITTHVQTNKHIHFFFVKYVHRKKNSLKYVDKFV